MSNIEKKLQALKTLPTIPDVIDKLERAAQDPKCDTSMIADVIGNDPTTAAGVLKLVNSVMFRPAAGSEVADLRVAITRIGVQSVRNVAMSASIFGMFSGEEHATFGRSKFWQHSIGVGVIASAIRQTSTVPGASELRADLVQLGGILHDLGKIIFEEHFSAEFHEAIELAHERQVPLYQMERELIGLDHSQAGEILCEKWRMPRELIDVVRHHHRPRDAEPGPGRALATLIHLADFIAHQKGIGASGNPLAQLDPELVDELGIDPTQLVESTDTTALEPS